MIMMLMMIIINWLPSSLSVPEEYQAAALYCDMRRSGDGVVQSVMKRTFSLSVSRAEVASSSRRILGSRMIALAMAMRCF